jgi:hypothetical protein
LQLVVVVVISCFTPPDLFSSYSTATKAARALIDKVGAAAERKWWVHLAMAIGVFARQVDTIAVFGWYTT